MKSVRLTNWFVQGSRVSGIAADTQQHIDIQAAGRQGIVITAVGGDKFRLSPTSSRSELPREEALEEIPYLTISRTL